jgi:hypothetical protein
MNTNADDVSTQDMSPLFMGYSPYRYILGDNRDFKIIPIYDDRNDNVVCSRLQLSQPLLLVQFIDWQRKSEEKGIVSNKSSLMAGSIF